MAASKSKRPRPKAEWVRIATPILSGSILRAGDRVKVYNPTHNRRTPKVQHQAVYGVRVPFELAPTFFSNFLGVDGISSVERKQLGDILGVELSERTCEDLDIQINRFVSGIALAQRLPS